MVCSKGFRFGRKDLVGDINGNIGRCKVFMF